MYDFWDCQMSTSCRRSIPQICLFTVISFIHIASYLYMKNVSCLYRRAWKLNVAGTSWKWQLGSSGFSWWKSQVRCTYVRLGPGRRALMSTDRMASGRRKGTSSGRNVVESPCRLWFFRFFLFSLAREHTRGVIITRSRVSRRVGSDMFRNGRWRWSCRVNPPGNKDKREGRK